MVLSVPAQRQRAQIIRPDTRAMNQRTISKSKQAGFTFIELAVAVVVLLIGVIGVAQLIPFSLDLDLRNRYNSLSLFVAERQLEQIVRQPVDVQENAAAPDYNFTDADGQPVYLGALPIPAIAPANQPPPNPVQRGCPVANGFIDFDQPCAEAGYTKTVTLGGVTFEVRWNVLTAYGNDRGTVRPLTKRITMAARGLGARPLPPLSLSVLVAP